MAFSLMRLLVSFTEGFSLAIRACRLCLVLKPEQWLEFEKGLQSVSLQATLIRLGIRGFNPKLKKAPPGDLKICARPSSEWSLIQVLTYREPVTVRSNLKKGSGQ
jgi:hypothetical protein